MFLKNVLQNCRLGDRISMTVLGHRLPILRHRCTLSGTRDCLLLGLRGDILGLVRVRSRVRVVLVNLRRITPPEKTRVKV